MTSFLFLFLFPNTLVLHMNEWSTLSGRVQLVFLELKFTDVP